MKIVGCQSGSVAIEGYFHFNQFSCTNLISVFTQSNTISWRFLCQKTTRSEFVQCESPFFISSVPRTRKTGENPRMTGQLRQSKAGMSGKPEQVESRTYRKSWNNQTDPFANTSVHFWNGRKLEWPKSHNNQKAGTIIKVGTTRLIPWQTYLRTNLHC